MQMVGAFVGVLFSFLAVKGYIGTAVKPILPFTTEGDATIYGAPKNETVIPSVMLYPEYPVLQLYFYQT